MATCKLNTLLALAVLSSGCDAAGAWWWHVPHGAGGSPSLEDAGTSGDLLATLPLSEAPAPSERFASWTMLWGTLDVSAPGFAVPPRDVLTLALDGQNHLRYSSWRTLPAFPKVYGDADGEFPLSGSKRVAPVGYGVVFHAAVLDAPDPTPEHFLLCTQLVSEDGISDFVESMEGAARDGGWDIVYSEQGRYFGAQIDAHGSGYVTMGDPNTPPGDGDSVWSAPIEVVSPGFVGGPVDHLAISLDADGQLRSFTFETFVRSEITFGTGPEDLPHRGEWSSGDQTVTVDPAIPPSADHFVMRYHVVDPGRLSDFREGIEGTREGGSLQVRYFIAGTLWGSTIAAHAAGTLYAARSNP